MISQRFIPLIMITILLGLKKNGAKKIKSTSGNISSGLLKAFNYRNIDTELSKQIIEKIDSVLSSGSTEITEFLEPKEYSCILESVSTTIPDISASSFGGFDQADRRIVTFHPSSSPRLKKVDNLLNVVNLSGNFKENKATKPDFLTTLISEARVSARQIGDIIVNRNEGAQVLVLPSISESIRGSISSVNGVPVKITVEPLESLILGNLPKPKPITSVESSLRLDAIASAGFGVSRSQMTKVISKGGVTVDWLEINNTAVNVKEGQVIVIQGLGKVVIEEITTTSKGKYRVTFLRTLLSGDAVRAAGEVRPI